jgi:hypothetical protein
MKKLSYDLRIFLDNLEKTSYIKELTNFEKQKLWDEFRQLRTNIINYYTFTRQYKGKFMEEL